MTGNVWFISAATSGFGKNIALEALRRGDKVVASSRNTSKLTDLSSAGALLIDLDVTAPDEEIKAAFKRAIDTYGKITHFINAAGYVLEGPIEGTSKAEALQAFNVNILGIINMTRFEVAILRPQGYGVIANFGSLASWDGEAAYGVYAAAKWAVSGFTESLYEEVKPFGVNAVLIEPGYFRTGFLNAGGGNRLFTKELLEEEYKGTKLAAVRDALKAADNKQLGDPVKGAKVIVDVLTSSGVAKGREMPMRLGLGSDWVAGVRAKLANTEKSIQDWHDITITTDHDDSKTA